MKRLLQFVVMCLSTLIFVGNTTYAQSFGTGKIGVSLSNAGRIRIWDSALENRMIDRLSLLIGGETNQVFSYNADADSATGSGGSKDVENPAQSDFQAMAIVDNLYGAHQDPAEPTYPPNVQAEINVYGWNNTNYLIVKMDVTNKETSALNATFGLEIIPQIDGNYGFESTNYDSNSKAFLISTSDTSSRVGVRLLSTEMTSLKTIDWIDGYDSTDQNLWNDFKTGTLEQSYTTSSADGTVTFLSANPNNINAGGKTTYYFAISLAKTDAAALDGLSAAVAKYNSVFAPTTPTGIPKIGYTLSNAGRLRIWDAALENRMIERISVLVGGETNQVFDYTTDADSAAGKGGSIDIENPTKSDLQSRTIIDNQYGAHQDPAEQTYPPNVEVEINVFSWNDVNYLIAQMDVTNKEASALNATFGLEIIPQIDGNYGFETTTYNSGRNSAIISTSDTSSRVGFRFLSTRMTGLKTIDWIDGYDSTDENLWNDFKTGLLEPTYTTSSADGTVTFMTAEPQSISAGGKATYYFAVALDKTDAGVLDGLSAALDKYNSGFTSVERIEGMPTSFVLSQNYPNPFNPTTKINFSLTKTGFVNLSVYNILGQKVAELVNENMNVGNYTVDFNASKLASGVYIYRLSTPSQSLTKKMSLLK